MKAKGFIAPFIYMVIVGLLSVLAHIFFIWVLIKSMSPREEIIPDLE